MRLPFVDKTDENDFKGGAEMDLDSLLSVLRSWTLCRSWMLMEDSGCDTELVDVSGAWAAGRSVAAL